MKMPGRFSMILLLPLLGLATLQGQQVRKGKSTAAQPAKANPVIEVREAGDLAPQASAWRIRIYKDGRIELPQRTAQANAADVRRLLERLTQLGFFHLHSEDLTAQLKAHGELRQILEGGHGVITLRISPASEKAKPHTVTLAHPEAYAQSRTQSVKQFRAAFEAIETFVSRQDTPPAR